MSALFFDFLYFRLKFFELTNLYNHQNMKKIILSLAVLLLIQSCSENQKKTQNETVTATEQTQAPVSGENQTAQPNEILKEMQEMMDEMHSKTFSGNNDEDYAEMMSDHHDAAVEMSEILIRNGKDEELKNFAGNVIKTQEKEIKMMDRFDNLTERSANSAEFQKELKATMAPMMNSSVPVHNDVDRDYAEQMIPHHQSAVEMAKVYKKFGKQPELLKLSDDIIATQQKEIEFLKQWLSK